MFGKRRHFLDPDAEAWQLECWSWLFSQHGNVEAFRETPLVLPNANFFPALGLHGHDRAVALFERVKKLCGLQSWPVELAPQNDMPAFLDGGAFIQHERSCAGHFSIDESGNAQIGYTPDYLDRPAHLIATFAHELGHYLHCSFGDLPPGGEELIEPATDMTACYFGFGIFGANASLVYEHDTQGWQGGKVGYLAEDEWVFALATFLKLRNLTIRPAQRALKPYLSRKLKQAIQYLEESGSIHPLTKMLS